MRFLPIAVGALLLLSTGAFGFESLDFWGENTHEKIAASALLNIPAADYPDLHKFQARLKAGSESEASHNTDAEATEPKIYWFGNQDNWETQARLEFTGGQYSQAYLHVGYVMHLNQDFQSPAHQKIAYHGPVGFAPDYRKSPEEREVIIRFVEYELDDLESYAGDNYNSADGSSFNFDQEFHDPLRNCPTKFWLSDAEDADLVSNGADNGLNATGAYGRNRDSSCDDPTTAGGVDWFADAAASTKSAISNRQLYQARVITEAELKRLSKEFPPKLSGLMIGGAGGGAPPIINLQTGSPISFRIAENRSANIVVKLFVEETGQAIVAENSILRIAAERGVNGAANETPLGGSTTWDNLSTALFDTKADDMALLPLEADFELTWKGVVAGGAALVDGNYTLCLNATDIDAKPAPAAQAGRCDTSVPFTIRRAPATPPTVDISLAGGFGLFNQLQGTALNTPTTFEANARVKIRDAYGVTAVNVPGTPTVLTPPGASLGSLPPGTKDVEFELAGLVLGDQVFSVTNASGVITQGKWRVETMTLAATDSAATYSPTSDAFSANISMSLNATAGAERITHFNINTQTRITDYAAGPFTLALPVGTAHGPFYFSLRDQEGNSGFQELNASESTFSAQTMQVTGSGSVSRTLSFPVDPTPSLIGWIKPGVIRIVPNDSGAFGLTVGRAEVAGSAPIAANPTPASYSLTVNGQVLQVHGVLKHHADNGI